MTPLLIIIYLAFIGLGLPDSLLGSAWPSMQGTFSVPVAAAGLVSMLISGSTIVSSLNTTRILRRFSVHHVVFFSVLLTGLALLGISFSSSYVVLCFFAILQGLGAGAIDVSLNNFVALHYNASHMNWLHGFWGVGASLGPLILSFFLLRTEAWSSGYFAISIILLCLTLILLCSMPLWKKAQNERHSQNNVKQKHKNLFLLLNLSNAKPAVLAFFCYCALEAGTGLWSGSYLVLVKGVSTQMAAGWVALYYIGITVGRFLSGFIAFKLSCKRLICCGLVLIAFGILLLFLPAPFTMFGLFAIGLGCAPIFPTMVHETPRHFGKEYSQAFIGLQMACAYLGTTFIPPLFGLAGTQLGYGVFPLFIALFWFCLVLATARLYRNRPLAH